MHLCQVPQLIENYKTGSADGISLAFLAVWFIGDIANLVGAIWARLVPTVIALAIYFCIADTVLIVQCLYYRRMNRPTAAVSPQEGEVRQPLLVRRPGSVALPGSRRGSAISYKSRDATSRAVDNMTEGEDAGALRAFSNNAICVLAVCTLGTVGWAVAWQSRLWKPTLKDRGSNALPENTGASMLGYLSALCYLGYDPLISLSETVLIAYARARIPQIIKNFRERSCEGGRVILQSSKTGH